MDSAISLKRNYIFVSSLKHLALVKTASTLWKQSDLRELFAEKISGDGGVSKDCRQVVENKVMKKVAELQLPRELRRLLICYIHRVGFQIFDWMNLHISHCGYITLTELPSEFFWTPQGYIDNKRVAETLVNDERLEIYTRFKLACVYCLEEYIKLLWKELPSGFYKNQSAEPIVMFWSYYVAGEIYQMYDGLRFKQEGGSGLTPFQFAFKLSVASANEAGTKYFLRRLTPENQRGKILLKSTALACRIDKYPSYGNTCLLKYHYANNLCYLLSEMSEFEQLELFADHAAEILYHLLNWPWQRFFLKTAKVMWCCLSREDYYILLQVLINKIYSDNEVYNYRKLFGKFWQRAPVDYNRHVILNDGLKSLSSGLSAVGDKENIKLIFTAATVLEKEEFIFCPEGQLICRYLIIARNWSLLKFFIQECTSSKSAFLKLKENLEFIFYSSLDIAVKGVSGMVEEFNQLLYDVEQQNKRKFIKDEVNSLTKRLSMGKQARCK